MNFKILSSLFIITIAISQPSFADFPKDSTKLDPSKNETTTPDFRTGGQVISGSVGDWINTGGDHGQCEEETAIIDTKDFSEGSAIAACPKGSKGVLTYTARDVFYIPMQSETYFNGWRAGVGDTPICINSDKNYSLNICAYSQYNNGDSQYCSPVYIQYTVTCVAQDDKNYMDPSCPVSTNKSCLYVTGKPKTYPVNQSGDPIPTLPR